MVVIALRTMVRPCRMVALLVLLTTDRLSFGKADGTPPPAIHGDVAANFTEITPSVRCNYKGRSYEPGSSVNTDQPCLKCTCVTGNLVCQLQVCPEMPDPPPQGCVVVHKKNKCCAHLQCYYEQFDAVHSKVFSLQTDPSRSAGPARMENSAAIVTFDGLPKGCVINGTIYAEGSAMDSSSLCEYCYCIKGRQQCVRPRCSMTVPGCTAVYKKHTCCPVRYQCSPLQNNAWPMKNTADDVPTTEEASSSSLFARLKDCRINGRLITVGEPAIGVARSSCETCFCINGQVRCDKVICPPIRAQISPNCGPVYSEGHCCPTSYNCTADKNESQTIVTTMTTIATSPSPSSSTMTAVAVADDDVLFGSPSVPSPTVTSAIPAETESVRPSTSVVVDNATTTYADPMESRHANPVGLTADDFGGASNVTEKSNKFEMDYDEPTLPPSLPNLKIIPFVAADAVFDEPVAAYGNNNDYQPVVERVYNVSDVEERPSPPVVNSFSPPIETEGGFVPKDSPDNGAVYTADKFRITTELVPAKPAVHLDEPSAAVAAEVVVGPTHEPTGSGVWCMSNGKQYRHGELLTDPSACNICVCFNAKIVCQENCPAVKVGCQRISDPDNNTCCGRIVCNDGNDTTGTESVLATTATLGDVVVEHIIHSARPPAEKPAMVVVSARPGATTTAAVELLAAHTEQPTFTIHSSVVTTPFAVPTTATTMKSTDPVTTTTTIKSADPATKTTPSSVVPSPTRPANRVEITTPRPQQPDDEDYSFESMFSFLFSGDTSTAAEPNRPSVVTATTTPTPATSPTVAAAADTVRVQHRTDDETDENKIVFIESAAGQMERNPGTNVHADRERDAAGAQAKPYPPRRDSVPERRPQTPHSDVGHAANPDAHTVTVTATTTTTTATTERHADGQAPVTVSAAESNFAAPSALKISGCNIYGRMYRVGKIIAELSNPCLECMCTEIGVHCNQTKC